VNIISAAFLTILLFSGFRSFTQIDTIVENVGYNYVKYYADNQLKILGNKDSAGKKNGYWMRFKRNGDLYGKGTYLNNRKHGTWTMVDKFGRCCWTGEYVNGFKEGEWSRGYGTKIIFRKDIKIRFIRPSGSPADRSSDRSSRNKSDRR
jgi:antitoxin component YwqK of YwqJK toxin-antitoxin module